MMTNSKTYNYLTLTGSSLHLLSIFSILSQIRKKIRIIIMLLIKNWQSFRDLLILTSKIWTDYMLMKCHNSKLKGQF